MARLHQQLVGQDGVFGSVGEPALLVDAAGRLVAIEGSLQSDEPVAEEAEPEFGQAAIIVLDDGRDPGEGVVVLVEQTLVVRVLEIALRHGEHVVEAKVFVVSGQEAVLGRLVRHNVGQIQSVLDLAHAPNAGRQQDNEGDHAQHLDGRFEQQTTVGVACEFGQGPSLAIDSLQSGRSAVVDQRIQGRVRLLRIGCLDVLLDAAGRASHWRAAADGGRTFLRERRRRAAGRRFPAPFNLLQLDRSGRLDGNWFRRRLVRLRVGGAERNDAGQAAE